MKPEPGQSKASIAKRKPGTRKGKAPVPAEPDDGLDLTLSSDSEADEVPARAAHRRSAPARAADTVPGKAAAATAPAGAEEDMKDEVMFTEEKSLDDVLAVSLPAARWAMRSLFHAAC